MLGSTILGRVTLKQRAAYSDGVRHGASWGGAFTPEAKAGLCVHNRAKGQCGFSAMSEGKEEEEKRLERLLEAYKHISLDKDFGFSR